MPSRRLPIAGVLFLGAFSAARVSFAQGTQQHPNPPPPPQQPPPAGSSDDTSRGSAVPRGASGATIVPPADPGQAPAPQAAPQVTPPKLVTDEGAQYPDAALKEGWTAPATVVLVLEIDTEGVVRKATVETPVGHGFDEAAVAAANKLRFEPAKRNGRAVAARIKHQYVFTPPPSRLVGRVAASASEAPIAGATVVVHAADGTEQSTQTAADGTWSIDKLPPGSYEVRVSAERFEPQSAVQEVKAGEEVSTITRLSRPAADKPVPAPEDEDVEEVTVKGVRPPREVTRRTLEQREMTRIPGTSGDALRSLQNLPGVARPPGLAGLLIVRGSSPNDTNIFIDGTLVPIVYHFGGLSSVVPSEMLQKIDFYPGNFSTQYGRVMGGIVDVGIRDPKKDRLHGMAQVDLIDARVMAEGPIGKTGWNFAIAGRRSYVDIWLKPVLESANAGVTTAPVYYDYQLMVSKDFGKNQNFRLMFLGSDDRLELLVKSPAATDPAIGGGIAAHNGFWRTQARYRNRISEDTDLKVMGAIGQDFADFTVGDVFFKLKTLPMTSRIELSQRLAKGVTANIGMDMLYTPYDVHVRAPPFPRPGEPPGGPGLSRPPRETVDSDALFRPGFYGEFELTPWRGGRIVPGVRLDYAKDTREWDIGPRVMARQDLTRGFPRTTLKGGVGIFYQPPQPQETNVVFGQKGLRSNRAYHYSFGVEQEITQQLEVSLEGYFKTLDRLVVPNNGNSGVGKAYGLETLIRYKPDSRFFGWLAYTLSRSTRQDTPSDLERLSPFSQTHILTVLGSYRLGRGWEFGARFRLVSGSMYTPNTYGFYDENAGVPLALLNYPPYTERMPMFHQLDIRVDKSWKFKDWQFSVYADIQNVYNHGNVEGLSYNYNYTNRTFATGLPFLPSLGMRGEF
ncbi:TonB family protein [Pendulispora albinea]|uniref:TonB family protein n=1 Tax=Pendulispora albinea TaxID=2741071 RepID=A0ABZ2LNA2_9BACT